MFKTLGFTVCSLLSVSVAASEFYNAKNLALGGVGVAGGDFRHSALVNPALVNGSTDEKPTNLGVSIGLLVSDEDELLRNANDLEEELEDVDDSVPSDSEAEDIVNLLNDLDSAAAILEFGVYFQAALPSDYLSIALLVNSMSDSYFTTNIDPADIAAINAAAGTSVYDVDTMTSEISVLDMGVNEYGVALGKTFAAGNTSIGIGITPKFQRVIIYDYAATVDNYDSDDIHDNRNRSKDSHVNADAGIHFAFNESLLLGVVAKNVIEEEFDTDINRRLDMETRVTAGLAHRSGGNLLELDVDLDSAKEFTSQIETQMVRFGVQLDTFDWAALRFGARHDLEDNQDDLFTFGLGFNPWGLTSFDLAAVIGENETAGFVAQFSFQF